MQNDYIGSRSGGNPATYRKHPLLTARSKLAKQLLSREQSVENGYNGSRRGETPLLTENAQIGLHGISGKDNFGPGRAPARLDTLRSAQRYLRRTQYNH